VRGEHRLRVFENRVLRKIFWSKRDKLRGEWRKLHNEELNDLQSSPNIFRVLKSRRMRGAEHVACMGERKGAYRVLEETLRDTDHLEDLGVDRNLILKLNFEN